MKLNNLRNLFILSLISANNALGATGGSSLVDIGISVLSHGISRTVNSPTGSSGFLGTNYTSISAQAHYPFTSELKFSPRVDYMPEGIFPQTAPDKGSTTTYLIGTLSTSYMAADKIGVSVGPSIMIYQIKGKGGTTTLSNGTGTSEFALPARTQTIKTIALQIGASYAIAEKYTAKLDVLTEGALSKDKRTFSLMLGVTYSALAH